jgi:hypothetical protein
MRRGCNETSREVLIMKQILRATHKIADHSVLNARTKKVDVFLVVAALCTAVNNALRINM